jgi:hypothetical protein
MCAGPHTGRHENGARGGPMWSAAPQRRSCAADREAARRTANPRGGPRSRAADREDGAADREAARQTAKTARQTAKTARQTAKTARQTAKPRGRPRGS